MMNRKNKCVPGARNIVKVELQGFRTGFVFAYFSRYGVGGMGGALFYSSIRCLFQNLAGGNRIMYVNFGRVVIWVQCQEAEALFKGYAKRDPNHRRSLCVVWYSSIYTIDPHMGI